MCACVSMWEQARLHFEIPDIIVVALRITKR